MSSFDKVFLRLNIASLNKFTKFKKKMHIYIILVTSFIIFLYFLRKCREIKRLTEKDIGKIKALCRRNISIKSVSEERPQHIIQNYLEDPNAYG